MTSTVTIAGTRGYAAYALRRLFFGWIALIIYLWIAAPFVWLAIQRENVLPLVIVIAVIAFKLLVLRLFIVWELEADTAPASGEGGAGCLSADLIHALRGKRYASSGDVLEAATRSPRGRFIIRQMGMESMTVASRCRNEMESAMDASSLIEQALASASSRGEPRVQAADILTVAFQKLAEGKAIVREADLSEEDLHALVQWESFRVKLRAHDPFWSPEAIAHSGSLGRSWVMGYTDALDHLTTDIADTVHLTGERKLVIHADRINAILHVLSRSAQRNVLIVGKVGVGKRTLVENMAAALRAKERAASASFTRVLQLHTQDLISGVQSPDAFLLQALNRAQSSGSFVLVIRDMALLLSSGSSTLRGVLMKFLEAKNIAIVGIVDTQDYHALIKGNPLLDSLFEKVQVDDCSDEDAMAVLMARTLTLERRGISITYKALKEILSLAKRYLSGSGGLPGIARSVFDDAVLRATEKGDAVVREEHVRDVVSMKGKVNVQRMTEGERDRLLTLEDTLRSRVIGQDAAIRAVSSALKRARLDMRSRGKPIGTFLFLGPTGVGKTQTAKVLAQEYFGSPDSLIRLDMNEFSHADSIFGIIGSPAAARSDGFLAQRVLDRPFSLILLDEIEKAHPTVLNLFLQILDEGFLTDNRGNRTDFRNTIIIATSNAGALFIRDFVKQHAGAPHEEFKAALLETILRDKLFSPEFVNRFDEVVLFYPLKQELAEKVAILMLDEIVSDLQKHRGIAVRIDADVLTALVERGYSVEFGAREMRRVITDIIEDHIAEYLLHHDVKRGDEIVIHASDIKW